MSQEQSVRKRYLGSSVAGMASEGFVRGEGVRPSALGHPAGSRIRPAHACRCRMRQLGVHPGTRGRPVCRRVIALPKRHGVAAQMRHARLGRPTRHPATRDSRPRCADDPHSTHTFHEGRPVRAPHASRAGVAAGDSGQAPDGSCPPSITRASTAYPMGVASASAAESCISNPARSPYRRISVIAPSAIV
jgi:hypothetical protein